MQKLTDLCQHILAITGIPPENLHSFADSGHLRPTGKDLGNYRETDTSPPLAQIEIGVWEYDGVVQLNNYPGSGLALSALIVSWLAEHDDYRADLEDPEIDVEDVGDGTYNVDVAINFIEPLTVRECPNGTEGAMPYMGKWWRIMPPTITPVEKLVAMQPQKAG
ncbi:phage tail protein [Desulfovibrio cuneatus]|uniref:phage tail protein n=1 Tax=Desulfovibrio cuneatus TaxID=159728 RepID=UPI0004016CD4|nr:phage tail protein [Desulfovibrio cuneatus]